ncbi:hypothetical protein [Hungatella effluvii]|uniref:hypothetical protein n=1 Tax=Hungatella effluvii TaxID=1096246 RepID=UPI002A7F1F83|nr:hypothetical protein [Hungatella effluvii]
MENNTMATDPNKAVMTMGEWLITLIVLAIPCVNVIMYFVWAFGNGNENRKNFCRAGLIVMAVGIVLTLILYAVFGASLAAALSAGY